jgi:transcriptional regulator GlxA family with amidase domain
MSEIAPRTVGIFIFDDVEVLDCCGPFEVFSVARKPDADNDETDRLFTPLAIAERPEVVACVGGLRLQPQATFTDHPPLDILIVPGGRGARLTQLHNRAALDWIAAQASRVEIAASVCTGAYLLAEIGLLDGKAATTHWSSIERLRQSYPRVTVREDVRCVDEGHIVTSAGISAGIDMSLHLVARLHGDKTARWTARRMEYNWRPVTAP